MLFLNCVSYFCPKMKQNHTGCLILNCPGAIDAKVSKGLLLHPVGTTAAVGCFSEEGNVCLPIDRQAILVSSILASPNLAILPVHTAYHRGQDLIVEATPSPTPPPPFHHPILPSPQPSLSQKELTTSNSESYHQLTQLQRLQVLRSCAGPAPAVNPCHRWWKLLKAFLRHWCWRLCLTASSSIHTIAPLKQFCYSTCHRCGMHQPISVNSEVPWLDRQGRVGGISLWEQQWLPSKMILFDIQVGPFYL